MFAKNSKAYSVYLLIRFVFSLAVSMSTVLSIVYHLEVVQLDAFQLVLVGTVLETSCFLFEIPTGVVADLYSRRRSVLIGMFLYGLGFLMEGESPVQPRVLNALTASLRTSFCLSSGSSAGMSKRLSLTYFAV